MPSRPQSASSAALGRRIVRALADAGSPDEAIGAVLAEASRHLGARVAVLWLLDASSGLLRWGNDWAENGAFDELRTMLRRLTFAPGVGIPGAALEREECVWAEDAGSDPALPRGGAIQAAGLRSVVGGPLEALEGVIGAVEFFSDAPWTPGADELADVRMTGRQLASYLGRIGVEERLRVSEEISAAIVRAALDCVITMDHEGRVLDFNPAAQATFGYERDAVAGRPLSELIIPPELRQRHREALARYVRDGQATILGRRLELTGMRADGSVFPIELTVTRLGTTEPPRFAGFVRDITGLRRAQAENDRLLQEAVTSRALAEAAEQRSSAAQVAAEQARSDAELAGQRLAFLAQASERMLHSRDYEATMRQVADLAVPAVADWCSVAIVGPGGLLQNVAVSHQDPAKAEVARRLVRRHPDPSPGEHGPAAVVRSGQLQVIEEVTDELLRAAVRDADYLEVLRELAPRSAVIVPLKTPTKVVGAVTFAMADSGRRFAPADVALAEALAARAALAIENARLFSERSHIAETLQSSLLPGELPDVPGLDVAARYRPAGDQNLVGGDFYDFFRSGDGVWTAILGDVSGKGAEAAALTALTRHTLRAGALRDPRPAANLELLNDALLAADEGRSFRFATVLYARVCPEREGSRVTLCTGGHLAPLIVRHDGSVEYPVVRGTLLGALRRLQLDEVEVRLGRGDLMLLYTDGVTEIRPQDPAFGERLLEEVVRREAGATAERIVAAVEGAAVEAQHGEPRDDIACIAIRVP